MNRKLLFFIVIIAAAVFWYFHSHTPQEASKSGAQGPVPVSVAAVMHKDMPLQVEGVGSVIAYETVAVRSRLDSQVTEVHFHDGDYVKKGDVLFVLDDRTLRAQMNALDANVKRDQAQLENARQQYERAKELTKRGYDSEANLDEAKAAYEVQKAAVHASDADVENLRVQLGYTRITAPISGRTGTINITVGNTVKANDTQPLVTINQVQPIRVHTSLPQGNYDALRAALKAGKVKALAVRDNHSTITEGVLEYIDNAVDTNTGTFVVRAVFDNKEEKLWPGMFATLVLTLGVDPQVMVIPEVAVQHGQKNDFVFAVADGKAEKRDVTVARIQEGLAVISKGLNDGEQVAIDGLMSLKDGKEVTLRGENKEPEKTPEHKKSKAKETSK